MPVEISGSRKTRMRYMIAAAEAVPTDPSSNELVFSIITVLLSLLAVAVAVGLLIRLLVLVGRVRRRAHILWSERHLS